MANICWPLHLLQRCSGTEQPTLYILSGGRYHEKASVWPAGDLN